MKFKGTIREYVEDKLSAYHGSTKSGLADDGALGKALEALIVYACTGRVEPCKSAGRFDLCWLRHHIEVKSNQSELTALGRYETKEDAEDAIADWYGNLFPGNSLLIYVPSLTEEDIIDALEDVEAGRAPGTLGWVIGARAFSDYALNNDLLSVMPYGHKGEGKYIVDGYKVNLKHLHDSKATKRKTHTMKDALLDWMSDEGMVIADFIDANK